MDVIAVAIADRSMSPKANSGVHEGSPLLIAGRRPAASAASRKNCGII
jgi:hypothetical protein